MKKVIQTLMVSIVLSALPHAGNAQSLDNIRSMIDAGQHKEAAVRLRPLADGGNAEAQALAAELFFEGLGVQQSNAQGEKYAKLSAEQGCEAGVQILVYYYGKIKKDEAMAYQTLHHYLYKFQLWNGELPVKYARSLLEGRGTATDSIRAWQILRLGEPGSPRYKYLLSRTSDYIKYELAEAHVTDVVQYVKQTFPIRDVMLDCIVRDYENKNPGKYPLKGNMWIREKENRFAKYIIAQLSYNYWLRSEDKFGENARNCITVATHHSQEALTAGVTKAQDLATELNSKYHVGQAVRVKGVRSTIFLVNGKDCCCASDELRLCNWQEVQQWMRQTGLYLANNDFLMKEFVKQLAKSGADVSGAYWINAGVCEFDAKGNFIKLYNVNQVPSRLGTKYKTYLFTNLRK